MSWLKKISQFDMDDDDRVWSYEDYKKLQNHPDMLDSYESIGHISPNTSIWKIDSNLRFHENTPTEEVPYKDRHHGLLDDPNFPAHQQDSISHGRVDMDDGVGSINLIGNSNESPGVRIQMKIFDILVSKYPGVRFFVWAGGMKKVSLQKYVESL